LSANFSCLGTDNKEKRGKKKNGKGKKKGEEGEERRGFIRFDSLELQTRTK
jgi:hypothetical protein